MEDMATGEIRLSILWEWLHKHAALTEADDLDRREGRRLTSRPNSSRACSREEYDKLLHAGNRDVHDNSKKTTLPIAREIVETYVLDAIKLPWYIDLLNITLNNHDAKEARRRIDLLVAAFRKDGTRITENLDFERASTT